MRNRRSSTATVETAIIQPPLPTGWRALLWSDVLTPESRLQIAGVSGVWAFRCRVEYGRVRAVALVRWHERELPLAEWRVAPLGAVSVEAHP